MRQADKRGKMGGVTRTEHNQVQGEVRLSPSGIEEKCKRIAQTIPGTQEAGGLRCTVCKKKANPLYLCDWDWRDEERCGECFSYTSCARVHPEGCLTVVFEGESFPI